MIDNNLYKSLNWEYIAGFFDGEGCIFFMKRNYSNTTQRYIMMHISQCEKHEINSHIIEDIYKFLIEHGIKARWMKYNKRNKNWQPAFRVSVSNTNGCKNWLNHMFPYLRVKRDKAIEALALIEEMINPNLSTEQIEKILNLRKDKNSLRKICRITKHNRATVTKFINKFPDFIFKPEQPITIPPTY